jgi:hypothetical protein
VKLSQDANSVNHQQARALFLSRLSKVKFVE